MASEHANTACYCRISESYNLFAKSYSLKWATRWFSRASEALARCLEFIIGLSPYLLSTLISPYASSHLVLNRYHSLKYQFIYFNYLKNKERVVGLAYLFNEFVVWYSVAVVN